jgi:hypothetical protein
VYPDLYRVRVIDIKNKRRACKQIRKSQIRNFLGYSAVANLKFLNPLPSGTRATFFLTAVGQIKHTEEGDISREKDDPDDVTAAREGRRR